MGLLNHILIQIVIFIFFKNKYIFKIYINVEMDAIYRHLSMLAPIHQVAG